MGLSFHIKMLGPVILISAIAFCNCIFKSITSTGLAPGSNPSQLNYGVAITDVDGQKGYEVVVAGYNGPNLVLKWNQRTKQLENIATDDPSSPYYALRDVNGQAIGVTACDVDGDGREEIYFLNTNSAYSGKATYPDKLFKWRDGNMLISSVIGSTWQYPAFLQEEVLAALTGLVMESTESILPTMLVVKLVPMIY